MSPGTSRPPSPADLAEIVDAACTALSTAFDLVEDQVARRSVEFAIAHARSAERRLRRVKTNTDKGESR